MRSFSATAAFRSETASSGTSPPRIRRASSQSSSACAGASRSTIESAFMATSVRKRRRWSSSVGRISTSRNSRTAAASSAADGRSLIPAPAPAKPAPAHLGRLRRAYGSCCLLDQIEQLVFHLGRQPAEDRKLDAPLPAAQVTARLRQRADRPLDVAEHLPDVELVEREPS